MSDKACFLCKKERRLIEGEFDDYLYCENCNNLNYDHNEDCCKDKSISYVKHTLSNKAIQVRMQCDNCGRIQGNALSRSKFDLDKLPFSEAEKEKEIIDKRHKAFKELEEELKAKKEGAISLEYEKYLESKTWKKKRALVLERDNYTCQSCLSSHAHQVHHLTYEHIYNEPLFDLVSVCMDCHRIITQMDRDRSNRGRLAFEPILHANEIKKPD